MTLLNLTPITQTLKDRMHWAINVKISNHYLYMNNINVYLVECTFMICFPLGGEHKLFKNKKSGMTITY